MVEGTAELATARRTRLWRTIGRLEDAELVVRVKQASEDAERTIEEWHDFVEGLDLATRAMRNSRRNAFSRSSYQLAKTVAS